MKDLKIAFVGGGHMAGAMIAGLLRSGLPAAQMRVGETLAPQREQLQQRFGVAALADNAEAVAGANLIVLAVKPQELERVLRALAPAIASPATLLLSIAAGIRVATIQRCCPGLPVVRCMPNRPALVGAGISALFAPAGVAAEQRQRANAVMQSCGKVCWVEQESQLDVVTALSGSGPAYFFWLAEQMAIAATRLGLNPAVAAQLAAETLYGAGQLAHLDQDVAAQRLAVTSKGGTTEAALAVLGQGNAIVADAIKAAAVRSAALSGSAPLPS
jgi:pyrroline-5-carboxylate reductase